MIFWVIIGGLSTIVVAYIVFLVLVTIYGVHFEIKDGECRNEKVPPLKGCPEGIQRNLSSQ